MKLQAGISQRAEQRLALLPQMLQSIEVLQMSTIDLLGWIEQELDNNAALEVVGAPLESTGAAGVETRADDERFDPDAFREPREAFDERAAEARHEMFANTPAAAAGLREHLLEQLGWLDVPAECRVALRVLIESLDERGLLPLDDAQIAELIGNADLVAAVRDMLRTSFEPRGVGARSGVEAMLWQLGEDDPDYALIAAMLREHLDSLAKHRLPAVARSLAIAVEDLEALVERVGQLDPRPGAAFQHDVAEPIRPDLAVVRDPDSGDGGFRIVVDDVVLPVLSVDPGYVAMASDRRLDAPARQHARERVRAARDVVQAVEQRRETLARVGAAVMARQREFLLHGRSGFRPLRMADIAAELGMHGSTISRATAGKYVATPHGTFALREFFDGDRRRRPGVNTKSPRTEADAVDADGMGRKAILYQIERWIADESPLDPLSDESLVERLAERGIEVARRTVAKYRNELGLASSWQRKQRS